MCVKGLNLGRAAGASTEDASTEDALSSPHAFCSPRKAFLSAPLRFVLFIRPGKVSEMKRNYICYVSLAFPVHSRRAHVLQRSAPPEETVANAPRPVGGGGRGDRGAGSLVAADDARLVWDFSKRIDELKESRWCLKTRDRRTDARWRQEGRGSRQRVLCLSSTRTLTHTLRLPSVSDATCRGRPVDLQLLQHD